jgi:hypothetical protein
MEVELLGKKRVERRSGWERVEMILGFGVGVGRRGCRLIYSAAAMARFI